ncbi:glucoamylase family protein [Paenibacillus montanisoli]|nr:glucoamylase family protein [Paenibacillus montanisoli]
MIGIDKGITLLMLENYRSGFVWKQYMKNAHVRWTEKSGGPLMTAANDP